MEVIGTIVAILVMLVLTMAFGGWVLSVLWGWFISPLLGVAPISVWQAAGLALVVSFLLPHREKERTGSPAMQMLTAVAERIMYGCIVLTLGYILKSFI